MASRSRHLTRNDPEGRFAPPRTAADEARFAASQAALEMVQRPIRQPDVQMPPIFSAREAAPWLGLFGLGGGV
ncbi:hypothetical protein [Streptomyces paludis]|uniref:Uncharacterized protein n=1 Tax=Streptomyces paludis TaxID=2282738 RepID=A0A345HWQ1_9ACTN|nr:hypothetical protein [Streptomyces paludis]AXG81125.1 hypothetical protein DVK44_29430 [Streptomyces paludis]